MNATLYCTRTLSLADIRTAARGWEVRPPAGGDELASLRSAKGRVTLTSMPARDIPEHLAGLSGYVASACTVYDDTFAQRVDAITQVIGWMIEVDDAQSVDTLLFALAERGGAMLFDGSAFISQDRRLLAGPGEDQLTPPPAERVLRRTWALGALAMRAYLEDPRADDAEAQLRGLRDWIAAVGLDGEFEDQERAVIRAARGALDRRQQVDGSWRSEGVVVLAWALGAGVLPDHQTQGNAFDAARALGFLGEAPRRVELRSPETIERETRRALGIHWRVRELTLHSRPVDFERFSREAWFGGFELDGIPLADGDLAVGGRPITVAEPSLVQMCRSIAMERHRAFNWLMGTQPVYADVDTST